MKTFFKLISILLAVTLLAAGLYQVFNNLNINLPAGGEHQAAFNQNTNNAGGFNGDQDGSGFGQREHKDGASGAAFGWLGLLQNVAKVAAITLGVVIMQKFFEKISRNSTAAAVQIK
ncbi:MAG: hypothetical protein LWX83_10500 [Anaerolineae bacterium]|nr:hypothetical protein [Anaerolineae bacterium]